MMFPGRARKRGAMHPRGVNVSGPYKEGRAVIAHSPGPIKEYPEGLQIATAAEIGCKVPRAPMIRSPASRQTLARIATCIAVPSGA